MPGRSAPTWHTAVMPLPRTLARLNRHALNRLAQPVARFLPGFGVVHHRGRNSDRRYTTPLNVFVDGDRFVIALTYGAQAEWLRNVMDEGGCGLDHRSQRIRLTNPQMITTEEGMAAMPPPVRAILRALDVTEFVRLQR